MATVSHIATREVRPENLAWFYRGSVTYSSVRPGLVKRIVAFCHSAFDAVAPFGYEDETGFHYGKMPEPDPARRSD